MPTTISPAAARRLATGAFSAGTRSSNAALAAHALQREIEKRDAHGVQTAYGVYLLAERTVWAPRRGTDDVIGLASPPEDAQGFAEFGDAVLRSQRIASLLGA